MSRIMTFLTCFVVSFSISHHAAADDSYEINKTFPAAGIENVTINAGVGTVEVVAGGGDEITVVVSLEPDAGWFGGVDAEDLQRIELASTKKSHDLKLKLDYPRGLDEDDVEEHWEVRMPASPQVKVRLGVGRISVEGVSGGVNARLGVGEITVAVPRGDVRAHTSVGNVRVKSATASAGKINLDADVGHVSLKLNGERIRADRGWGPGHSLQHEGSGSDEFDVSANVGNAELSITGG